mmetsp:Transcript_64372/g.199362  ORF Transcript_64372/g.199362 Transcript_64372/m.199362 type:complete len:100 (+) Transcript_64372:378-677(+)
MEEGRLEPNLIIYSQLLNVCAKARPRTPKLSREVAEDCLRKLVSASIAPDAVAIGALDQALGAERRAELCAELGVSSPVPGARVVARRRKIRSFRGPQR